MKYIVYGQSRVLTTDPAAYAAALAQSGLADRVDVPTVDVYGVSTVDALLLAPAIGIHVQSAPDDELGPDTDAFVRDVAWRTRAVRSGAGS